MIEKELLEEIKVELLSSEEEIDSHTKKWYEYFNDNFGKDFLYKNNMSKENLLVHLFGSGKLSNNNSLLYLLEFSKDVKKFGSIQGTYSYNYPIRYSEDKSSWVISDGSNISQKYVSIDDAIKEMDIVIGEFIDIFNKVESLKPFNSIDAYVEFDYYLKNFHSRFYNKMWFLKYLHMLYPTYFANFYNNSNSNSWLPMLNRELGLPNSSNSKIVLNGQLVLYSKSNYVYPYFLSLILYECSKRLGLSHSKDRKTYENGNIKLFFEPLNLNDYDLFEHLKNPGDKETFVATKKMKIGDYLLLFVGSQNENYSSGIYGVSRVISEPYIYFEEGSVAYSNGKLSVDTELVKISTSPIIDSEKTKKYVNQFRSKHCIDEKNYNELRKILGVTI